MDSPVLTRREMRGAQPADTAPDPLNQTLHHAAIARLHRLIDECGDTGVSDMHIHPDKPMRRLRSGKLFIPDGSEVVFSQAEIMMWLDEATEGKHDPLNPRGHASVALATEKYRVRGTFRKSLQGVTVTFRIIPGVVPDVDAIGVPQVIQNLIHRDSGLLIMEGPTGSGKTTAIAGLIKLANKTYDKHIYMVEDPTEFVHEEIGATSIVQREIGTHVVDYPTAIEDALRSKPNIIVVGELLNAATAKAALHAATTGHLVITTAHAGSITEALDSFIGQFTADEQPQIRSRFSQSLLGIMVQKLVPTVDGRLTAAREVLLNDLNFTEIIRDDKMQMIRARIAGSKGCFTLEDSLADLVVKNAITIETAIGAAKNPDDLRETLARKGVNL
ncbi:type IV pilus twitching motility protein PilT [Arthrobacter caoxuetaonis]|uniref:Flp pilus assembly complex ATPase component TadA n=1 Tax=Arthrobacter caoxuetaonis TaxID=2886935 RepID=A0A9X1MHA4_9MICC|nr:ATPase, T2SS/T4P/T4SS family [Arthrobacter caoxuetaonis]MCC3299240.1 Flp pilus assembly complex ATPase component TadA [Arthrobacter caoxuetaonis]USQ59266.1 Flp pilus assembly complex ATPase component TadA [Arthrobacter caoxuetaonis]